MCGGRPVPELMAGRGSREDSGRVRLARLPSLLRSTMGWSRAAAALAASCASCAKHRLPVRPAS